MTTSANPAPEPATFERTASIPATVLVTGGTGFLAHHCIAQLIAQGYRVRTTVRSLDSESIVRARLDRIGCHAGGLLSFVAADLLDDDGWPAAVDGCRYVLHVASPVVVGRRDDDVVEVARGGTRRVLRAARAAGVQRVVFTSAFHAIGFGWGASTSTKVFTEEDWSPLDGPGIDDYGRSKVLAERAAWETLADNGSGATELTVVNPVAVVGPTSGATPSGLNAILASMLVGGTSTVPDIWFPIVDVRDVAVAEVAAMTEPAAAGQRIIVASGEGLTTEEIARLLQEHLGERAANVAHHAVTTGAGDLTATKQIDHSKSFRVLHLPPPRSAADAVVDAAVSLLDTGR